jgi:YgiT-type zinc finger domain-containing protein
MSKKDSDQLLPEYGLSALKVRTMGAGWKARRNPEGLFAKKVNFETCRKCGKEKARIVRLPHVFISGKKLVVIQNIPTMVCQSCVAEYIEDEILKDISEVLENPEVYLKEESILVGSFK